MSEMNHERFEDLRDAYVLGALPEDERRSFEDYLAAHPERQAEIDELGAVAGLIAFSPQEQEPSPELRSRIMEVVAAEAEPRRVRRRSTFARIGDYLSVRSLALGAAALLVVGLLSWNVLLQGEVQDLQGQVEGARDRQQDRRSGGTGPAAGPAKPDDRARGSMGGSGRQRRSCLHPQEQDHPRGQEHAFGARGQDVPDLGDRRRRAQTKRSLPTRRELDGSAGHELHFEGRRDSGDRRAGRGLGQADERPRTLGRIVGAVREPPLQGRAPS